MLKKVSYVINIDRRLMLCDTVFYMYENSTETTILCHITFSFYS